MAHPSPDLSFCLLSHLPSFEARPADCSSFTLLCYSRSYDHSASHSLFTKNKRLPSYRNSHGPPPYTPIANKNSASQNRSFTIYENMQFLSVSAAAVLALASCVRATNMAIVKNHCTDPVYLWSTGEEGDPLNSKMITLKPHQMPYAEHFRTRSDNGGIVIKISTDPQVMTNITQFEYTLNEAAIWYDISHINGDAFPAHGTRLEPNVAAKDSCVPLTCSPGEVPCAVAYNNPDDVATHACVLGTDITMTLCPATTPKRDATPEAAPEAVPEPAPEAAAAPAPHLHVKRHTHSHQRRARRGTLGSHV